MLLVTNFVRALLNKPPRETKLAMPSLRNLEGSKAYCGLLSDTETNFAVPRFIGGLPPMPVIVVDSVRQVTSRRGFPLLREGPLSATVGAIHARCGAVSDTPLQPTARRAHL
jgi:hypothetical protein